MPPTATFDQIMSRGAALGPPVPDSLRPAPRPTATLDQIMARSAPEPARPRMTLDQVMARAAAPQPPASPAPELKDLADRFASLPEAVRQSITDTAHDMHQLDPIEAYSLQRGLVFRQAQAAEGDPSAAAHAAELAHRIATGTPGPTVEELARDRVAHMGFLHRQALNTVGTASNTLRGIGSLIFGDSAQNRALDAELAAIAEKDPHASFFSGLAGNAADPVFLPLMAGGGALVEKLGAKALPTVYRALAEKGLQAGFTRAGADRLARWGLRTLAAQASGVGADAITGAIQGAAPRGEGALRGGATNALTGLVVGPLADLGLSGVHAALGKLGRTAGKKVAGAIEGRLLRETPQAAEAVRPSPDLRPAPEPSAPVQAPGAAEVQPTAEEVDQFIRDFEQRGADFPPNADHAVSPAPPEVLELRRERAQGRVHARRAELQQAATRRAEDQALEAHQARVDAMNARARDEAAAQAGLSQIQAQAEALGQVKALPAPERIGPERQLPSPQDFARVHPDTPPTLRDAQMVLGRQGESGRPPAEVHAARAGLEQIANAAEAMGRVKALPAPHRLGPERQLPSPQDFARVHPNTPPTLRDAQMVIGQQGASGLPESARQGMTTIIDAAEAMGRTKALPAPERIGPERQLPAPQNFGLTGEGSATAPQLVKPSDRAPYLRNRTTTTPRQAPPPLRDAQVVIGRQGEPGVPGAPGTSPRTPVPESIPAEVPASTAATTSTPPERSAGQTIRSYPFDALREDRVIGQDARGRPVVIDPSGRKLSVDPRTILPEGVAPPERGQAVRFRDPAGKPREGTVMKPEGAPGVVQAGQLMVRDARGNVHRVAPADLLPVGGEGPSVQFSIEAVPHQTTAQPSGDSGTSGGGWEVIDERAGGRVVRRFDTAQEAQQFIGDRDFLGVRQAAPAPESPARTAEDLHRQYLDETLHDIIAASDEGGTDPMAEKRADRIARRLNSRAARAAALKAGVATTEGASGQTVAAKDVIAAARQADKTPPKTPAAARNHHAAGFDALTPALASAAEQATRTPRQAVGGALREAANWTHNWAEPLIDRVRRAGGDWGAALSEKAAAATDTTKALMRQWEPTVQAALKTASGVGDHPLKRLKALRNLMRIEEDGASGGGSHGFSRFQRAVEGKIPDSELDPIEKEVVDAYRRVVAMTGATARDMGVQVTDPLTGQRVAFRPAEGGKRMIRHLTPEAWDMIHAGADDPGFRALVKAVSDANGGADVKLVTREMLELRDADPVTRSAAFEHLRTLKEFPTHVKVDGHMVPVLHSNPFTAIDQLYRQQAMRLGYIAHFGQNPEAATAAVKRYVEAGGARADAEDLIRALNGVPPAIMKAVGGSNLRQARRVGRAILSLFKTGLLSRSGLVNLPEPLGNTLTFAGSKRLARAYAHLAAHPRAAAQEAARWGVLADKMLNLAIEPGRKLEDVPRVIRQITDRLNPLSGHYANDLNELVSAWSGKLMADDLQAGRGTAADRVRLDILGYTDEQADRMLAGKASAAEYEGLPERMATISQGAGALPAQRSKAGNSRLWNAVIAFDSYAQMKANRLGRTISAAQRAWNRGDKAAAFQVMSQQVLGTTASGAGALALRAAALGGTAGLMDFGYETIHDPVASLGGFLRSAVMSGAADALWRVAAESNPNDFTDSAWDQTRRIVLPVYLAGEMIDFFAGQGRYHDQSAAERARTFLEGNVTVTRPLVTLAATLGLADKDLKRDTAISAYWRWRRENAPADRHIPGQTTPEHERFRRFMRRAVEDIRHNRNPAAHLRQALGVSGDGSSVAASLRGRRLLSDLKPDQLKALAGAIGPDQYHELQHYDWLLTHWAAAE